MAGKRQTRGRPAKAAVEGERNALGLRVTADLKRKIEEAAAASGRSQSQEAEFRLERSFSFDREALAVPTFHRAMVILAVIKEHIEEKAREEGLTGDEKRSALLACWIPVLKEMVLSHSQLQAGEDPKDRGTVLGNAFVKDLRAALIEVDKSSGEEA